MTAPPSGEVKYREACAETVRLYRMGLSSREICARLGIAKSTLCSRLKVAVVMRPAGFHHPIANLARAADEIAAGAPTREVSEKYDIPRTTLRDYCRSRGVQMLPPGGQRGLPRQRKRGVLDEFR